MRYRDTKIEYQSWEHLDGPPVLERLELKKQNLPAGPQPYLFSGDVAEALLNATHEWTENVKQFLFDSLAPRRNGLQDTALRRLAAQQFEEKAHEPFPGVAYDDFIRCAEANGLLCAYYAAPDGIYSAYREYNLKLSDETIEILNGVGIASTEIQCAPDNLNRTTSGEVPESADFMRAVVFVNNSGTLALDELCCQLVEDAPEDQVDKLLEKSELDVQSWIDGHFFDLALDEDTGAQMLTLTATARAACFDYGLIKD